MNRCLRLLLSLSPALLAVLALPAQAEEPLPAAGSDDPAHYVQFVLEDDSDCLLRDGKHVTVHSTHPSRSIRVWLDRYYHDVGTGDRSRSDLKPGAEPEGLGCSRVDAAPQEWRIVRAQFLN